MRTGLLAALASAVLLVGCAARPLYEGGRAWSEGWREGEVERVGTASDLGYRQSYDCRYRDGNKGRESDGRFAVVALRDSGGHRHHVVPVSSAKEIPVGSRVLTNHHGCDAPVPLTR